MAKKEQKSRSSVKKKSGGRSAGGIIIGILAILLALVSVAGLVGGAGAGGTFVFQQVWLLFGAGYVLFPIGFGLVGAYLLANKYPKATLRQWTTASVGVLSVLGLLTTVSPTANLGGYIGESVALPVVGLFDRLFGAIILACVVFGAFTIFFNHEPVDLFTRLKSWLATFFNKFRFTRGNKAGRSPEEEPVFAMPSTPLPEEPAAPREEPAPYPETIEESPFIPTPRRKRTNYAPPPLSLLEQDRGKAQVGDVKMNTAIIKRTLANFGIEVEMDEVTIGPSVTRYALKPAQGIKLSRIAALQNDLALALAAHPIRMELPIPGKSLVGIEIPNKAKSTVGLGSLLADPTFGASTLPLLVAVGKNISGKIVLESIAKMPHLLIAGTTGSGKSVSIHCLITSLLYRHGPDELRFIFVDPKRVELTLYNKIPHLLTPVITDPKRAILALKWAANEMSRRYDILEAAGKRDISSYHRELAQGSLKENDALDAMPYIVIVIDELADIMAAYPRELESAIVRLAQMSRAVGIHLVLSTQRPEVNVITGLIKANIPSRIALRVPTQIDSRTILDAGGAEKLLGQGDMLAIMGQHQPERLQSAYITEEEVKGVVKYLADAFRDEIQDTIELSGPGSVEGQGGFEAMLADEDNDDLYDEAKRVVEEAGKASTSYLQRKIKVGYARAARIMDILEERGVIGPADGAKPREVLRKSSSPAAPRPETIPEEPGRATLEG